MSQQPAHKIRFGVLQVTIWRNHGEKGTSYSVTPSRSYKVEDAWKQSDSLWADDLLPMAKLLDQAHTWIANAQRADQKARRDAETGQAENEVTAA